MTEYTVRAIGRVVADRSDRIDDGWGSVESVIRLDEAKVTDIKPHLREFDPRGDVGQPPWSSELMARYW